jgi:S-methylmethionine-dependent homocysteine/selenocysteine methylase
MNCTPPGDGAESIRLFVHRSDKPAFAYPSSGAVWNATVG